MLRSAQNSASPKRRSSPPSQSSLARGFQAPPSAVRSVTASAASARCSRPPCSRRSASAASPSCRLAKTGACSPVERSPASASAASWVRRTRCSSRACQRRARAGPHSRGATDTRRASCCLRRCTAAWWRSAAPGELSHCCTRGSSSLARPRHRCSCMSRHASCSPKTRARRRCNRRGPSPTSTES